MKRHKRLFLCFLMLQSILTGLWAQSSDTQIANEYFLKHDYEKAFEYYKKQIKKPEERKYVYTNYLICAQKLNEYLAAIKQLDKIISDTYPNTEYKVDKAILLKHEGKTSESNTIFNALKNEAIQNISTCQNLGNYYVIRKLNEQAIDVYISARKEQKNNFLFADELSVVYKNLGRQNEMMDEWLNILESDASKVEHIQNQVATYLSKKEEKQIFLDKLFQRLSLDNDEVQFSEVMAWMYMQNKDFYNAFIQLRSIDKKVSHHRGESLIELGDVALKNKDYKNALIIYSYVTETYPNEYHFEETQKKRIQTKEIQVKQSYPTDIVGVKQVISEYDVLLAKSKLKNVTAEILLSQAELHAVYLHQTDKAVELINLVVLDPRQNQKKQAEAKLLLGDIYLLQNKIGEAMLEYMQVERMIEDDDLGHLAKLKTAKSFYYDSEFELAQEQLDILKRATSRKIANDAQDLSLLIKGNNDMDSTNEAMSMYAKTELLIYQKKFDEAISTLQEISKKFPAHSLLDEMSYQKAQIYEQTNQIDKAIEELKIVIQNKDAILSDDALNQLAQLYDYKLRNYTEAKEYYKKMLLDFPGSIYVAEARKRYYEL